MHDCGASHQQVARVFHVADFVRTLQSKTFLIITVIFCYKECKYSFHPTLHWRKSNPGGVYTSLIVSIHSQQQRLAVLFESFIVSFMVLLFQHFFVTQSYSVHSSSKTVTLHEPIYPPFPKKQRPTNPLPTHSRAHIPKRRHHSILTGTLEFKLEGRIKQRHEIRCQQSLQEPTNQVAKKEQSMWTTVDGIGRIHSPPLRFHVSLTALQWLKGIMWRVPRPFCRRE